MPKKGHSAFDSYSARVKKTDAAVDRVLGIKKATTDAIKSPKKAAAKDNAMKSAKKTVDKNESRLSSKDRSTAKTELRSKALKKAK